MLTHHRYSITKPPVPTKLSSTYLHRHSRPSLRIGAVAADQLQYWDLVEYYDDSNPPRLRLGLVTQVCRRIPRTQRLCLQGHMCLQRCTVFMLVQLWMWSMHHENAFAAMHQGNSCP